MDHREIKAERGGDRFVLIYHNSYWSHSPVIELDGDKETDSERIKDTDICFIETQRQHENLFRVSNSMEFLRRKGYEYSIHLIDREATDSEICLFHTESYLKKFKGKCANVRTTGIPSLLVRGTETTIEINTETAVKQAIGCVLEAIDACFKEEEKRYNQQ